MFIRPTEEELKDFEPDFVSLNASKITNPDWKEMGMNSEVFVVFNLGEKMSVIGGSWYGGENKKGIFSVMNYFLPLKGIAAMELNAGKIVVCGMQTQMCVEAAVRAAADKGYEVTLISDACATKNLVYNGVKVKAKLVQAETLATLKSYAKIITTKEFLTGK